MDKYDCFEAIHEIEKEIFSLVKKTQLAIDFSGKCASAPIVF